MSLNRAGEPYEAIVDQRVIELANKINKKSRRRTEGISSHHDAILIFDSQYTRPRNDRLPVERKSQVQFR